MFMALLFSYDDTIHKKGRMIYVDKFSRYVHRYRFVSVVPYKPSDGPVAYSVIVSINDTSSVSGESTTIYKLVSSVSSRISEPTSSIMSFI